MTREESIQQVIDNNFANDGLTLQGVLPYIHKRYDKIGAVFGWGDVEYQHRVFMTILNVKGFKQHLQNTIDKLKEGRENG